MITIQDVLFKLVLHGLDSMSLCVSWWNIKSVAQMQSNLSE